MSTYAYYTKVYHSGNIPEYSEKVIKGSEYYYEQLLKYMKPQSEILTKGLKKRKAKALEAAIAETD